MKYFKKKIILISIFIIIFINNEYIFSNEAINNKNNNQKITKQKKKRNKPGKTFIDLGKNNENEPMLRHVVVPLFTDPSMKSEYKKPKNSLLLYRKRIDYYKQLNPDKKKEPFNLGISFGISFRNFERTFFSDLFNFNYRFQLTNKKPTIIEYSFLVDGLFATANEQDPDTKFSYLDSTTNTEKTDGQVYKRRRYYNTIHANAKFDYNDFIEDFTMFFFVDMRRNRETQAFEHFAERIEFRSNWGYGWKYDLYEGDFITDLDISFAPIIDYEKIETLPLTTKGKPTPDKVVNSDKKYRGSLRFRFKVKSQDNKVTLNNQTYYQPNIEESEMASKDWILTNNLYAEIKITEKLAYVNNFNVIYESQPLDPNKPSFNISFTSSFKYNLGFDL